MESQGIAIEDWDSGLSLVSSDIVRDETHLPVQPRVNRWRMVIALGVLLIGVIAGWLMRGMPSLSAPPLPAGSTIVSDASAASLVASSAAPSTALYSIQVDVQGDVKHPGVVRVGDQARVLDAVRAAGGFRHAVDSSLVNTAAILVDGQEIVVPGPLSSALGSASSDVVSGGLTADSSVSVPTNSAGITPMDLNSSTLSSLETLPDIGPSRAQAILQYRAQIGRFTSVSQLLQVHGIGSGIFARISPYLTVTSVQPISSASKP